MKILWKYNNHQSNLIDLVYFKMFFKQQCASIKYVEKMMKKIWKLLQKVQSSSKLIEKQYHFTKKIH
jgi:hypothetical protein